NNAYCQDNTISWDSWEKTPASEELLAFTRELVKIRKTHPTFRRKRYFRGLRRDARDVMWYHSTGEPLTSGWEAPGLACFGMLLGGDAFDDLDAEGFPVRDAHFLLLINGSDAAVPFVLPGGKVRLWRTLIDTAAAPRREADVTTGGTRIDAGA